METKLLELFRSVSSSSPRASVESIKHSLLSGDQVVVHAAIESLNHIAQDPMIAQYIFSDTLLHLLACAVGAVSKLTTTSVWPQIQRTLLSLPASEPTESVTLFKEVNNFSQSLILSVVLDLIDTGKISTAASIVAKVSDMPSTALTGIRSRISILKGYLRLMGSGGVRQPAKVKPQERKNMGLVMVDGGPFKAELEMRRLVENVRSSRVDISDFEIASRALRRLDELMG
jgi:hypothetical protein